jgi:hypothetical protein
MQTYLVRAALDRSVASVERGLQGLATPMVGRDAELQRLLHAVAQARQTRQLQALTLLGDAGLGKSRLLRELSGRACSGLPRACAALAARRPAAPLGPAAQPAGLQCGVADTDSADVARRKVVEGLSPCFDERGERQAQLIGQLSGLDFADSPHRARPGPAQPARPGLQRLRAYLQPLARAAPAGADGRRPALGRRQLAGPAAAPAGARGRVAAGAGDDGPARAAARRPDWGTPLQTTACTLTQPAGPRRKATNCCRRCCSAWTRCRRAGELIVGRAEGNPYYMEELVRRLIDDGVIDVGEPHWTVQTDRLDTLRLPSTLVGLLQARLDALPASERQPPARPASSATSSGTTRCRRWTRRRRKPCRRCSARPS